MKIQSIITVFLSVATLLQAQVSKTWVSDNGDGTFKNPIVYADYSDPDLIRVGDDYYMTASSFNCVPGLPILHSKDLVNWKLVNYALTDLNLPGVEPANFFDTAQHGKGVWAPCFRYHNGTYYIYWGDPDFGIYLTKTKDVLGKWEKPILVLAGKGRIDPSPLFDDDGKVYMLHAWANSRARLNSVMTLCELNAEGTEVIGEEVLVYDGNNDGNHTVEGGKFYKKDGYYYLLAPAGGVATGWQIALRSKNVYGPYECKTVMAQGKTNINGPHQGGLVQTQTGEWWFLHFQDVAAYGRILHLNPVQWQKDWPTIGENVKNFCGEPVRIARKPNVGATYPIQTPQESDEFDTPKLGLQWQWHANPKQTYGYTSSYGYLRLYGQYYPENYSNMWNIPNLLLQKYPAPVFTATTKLSAVLMNEGDKAGLISMGWDYGYIALEKTAEGYALVYNVCHDAEEKNLENEISRTPLTKINVKERYNYKTPIPEAYIYLRVSVVDGGICTFSYSVDGKKYTVLPQTFKARQGKWIGAKMGLFVMNAKENTARSWVDADWFRVE